MISKIMTMILTQTLGQTVVAKILATDVSTCKRATRSNGLEAESKN